VSTFQDREIARLSKLAIESWLEQRRRPYPYILPPSIAEQNLLPDVRTSAIDYFAEHDIKWWLSDREKAERRTRGKPPSGPTGHMNSSQVACVNHLEPARLDETVALAVARLLEPHVASVRDTGEGGFVAFEWIGERDYLGEADSEGARRRGEYVTSADALMRVTLDDGEQLLLVIEWKYLEQYDGVYFGNPRRLGRYRPLIDADGSPIVAGEAERLFYDPYYQLLRQTLLAAAAVADPMTPETGWRHMHVIPRDNEALRTRVKEAAPLLLGATVEETWRSALTKPERYRVVDPSDAVPRADSLSPRWRQWRTQLGERYLT